MQVTPTSVALSFTPSLVIATATGLTYLCKAVDPKVPETKKEDRDAVTFTGYTDSGGCDAGGGRRE